MNRWSNKHLQYSYLVLFFFFMYFKLVGSNIFSLRYKMTPKQIVSLTKRNLLSFIYVVTFVSLSVWFLNTC